MLLLSPFPKSGRIGPSVIRHDMGGSDLHAVYKYIYYAECIELWTDQSPAKCALITVPHTLKLRRHDVKTYHSGRFKGISRCLIFISRTLNPCLIRLDALPAFVFLNDIRRSMEAIRIGHKHAIQALLSAIRVWWRSTPYDMTLLCTSWTRHCAAACVVSSFRYLDARPFRASVVVVGCWRRIAFNLPPQLQRLAPVTINSFIRWRASFGRRWYRAVLYLLRCQVGDRWRPYGTKDCWKLQLRDAAPMESPYWILFRSFYFEHVPINAVAIRRPLPMKRPIDRRTSGSPQGGAESRSMSSFSRRRRRLPDAPTAGPTLASGHTKYTRTMDVNEESEDLEQISPSLWHRTQIKWPMNFLVQFVLL